MKKQSEHGGVFFYILIAIVLLAALSYSVARNNRGNSNLLTDEQARVAATEIIEYGNTVAATVQKLKLRGCRNEEISFENNISSRNYPNTNSPTNNSCHIFNISGGNINWLINPDLLESYAINAGWDNWYYDGRSAFQGQGNDCANSTCSELSLTSWGLNEKVCIKINELLDIDDVAGRPPTDNISGDPAFDGTFSYDAAHVVGDTTPELSGKPAACMIDASCAPGPSSECYVYYHVLIAR